jgi:hypothetical protein
VEAKIHAFLSSVLDGGKWLASRPDRFKPRERVPDDLLDRRLGEPQRRSGRGGEEKNTQPLPGLDPPDSRYEIHKTHVSIKFIIPQKKLRYFRIA